MNRPSELSKEKYFILNIAVLLPSYLLYSVQIL